VLAPIRELFVHFAAGLTIDADHALGAEGDAGAPPPDPDRRGVLMRAREGADERDGRGYYAFLGAEGILCISGRRGDIMHFWAERGYYAFLGGEGTNRPRGHSSLRAAGPRRVTARGGVAGAEDTEGGDEPGSAREGGGRRGILRRKSVVSAQDSSAAPSPGGGNSRRQSVVGPKGQSLRRGSRLASQSESSDDEQAPSPSHPPKAGGANWRRAPRIAR